MPLPLLSAVAAVALLAGGRAAMAQTIRVEAPTAPPAGEHRPALPRVDAYVDDADAAHPVWCKFTVDEDDYSATVDLPGGDSAVVQGTLKDGVLDGFVAANGFTKFNGPFNGKTFDVPISGHTYHFKRADSTAILLPTGPDQKLAPVAEADADGWHSPRPGGWAVHTQPGGVTLDSGDGRDEVGYFYVAQPNTADPMDFIAAVLKASGIADAKRGNSMKSTGDNSASAMVGYSFTGRDNVDRRLTISVAIGRGSAPHTAWVGVVLYPATGPGSGAESILKDLQDHMRPSDASATPSADNPLAPAAKDPYVGLFADGQLTVTVHADAAAGGYAGTIVKGDRKFELTATKSTDGLSGTFGDGAGHGFPLTMAVDATGVMTLKTGDLTYTLKP